ncbi:hypothetical protein B0H11DRAFT_2027306 [Mycena galericulata]|nr:hypothetical protein B0H11DRAFT_2103568 [Mycena galericulata]KAJ7479397.1 hypothetical protein B0H11DRAFT_2027306 [Mycena galericulata]
MKNVHPVLGAITSTFTVIIKIEIERRENDSRVAKLHLTMTDFLVVLGSLTATFQVAVSLQELLERFLQSVCVTMNEFRDVCQAYYSLGTLGHLAQAIKYKTKFAAFKTAFDEHKKQLQDLLGSNTATTLTSMNGTVDRLDRNVQQLVMQNQQLAMQNQQLLTKIREN